ncbi:CGNR zinc finger domain-containing protein [Kitasatospora atroaurantiaca]|uniref:CGNR zinc finger domain-containing protein n=1 Tax=Kitasatospora atroaurantiaca TaxID=285545 RepID=UPI001FE3D247|nr:ABATE domain-containing protein [Kitasatospora atroaurantiaca]
MNDFAFPLTGEPLALDLINTRPVTANGPVDLLATPTGLRAWLALQADRLPEFTTDDSTPLTEADLATVHGVREHAATAIDRARRGDRPPATALRGLNHAQRAAPATRELAWDGKAVTATTHRTGTFGTRLAARLAEATADLLLDPSILKVRRCEGPGCVMLFLPAHPRRRWCTPAICGNRARVARYYQRHKGA